MENINRTEKEDFHRIEAFADYVFEVEKERFDNFCITWDKTPEEKAEIELGFRMGCMSAALISKVAIKNS